MRIQTAICILSILTLSNVAAAGGLISAPDTGLDKAQDNVKKAVPNYRMTDQGKLKSLNPSLVEESDICLTASGSCKLDSVILKGTACYCIFDERNVFGTTQ